MNYNFYLPKIENNTLKLLDASGNDVLAEMVANGLNMNLIEKAIENNQSIRFHISTERFRRVDADMYFEATQSAPTSVNEQPIKEENEQTHEEIVDFIQNKSVGMKPDMLLMNELTWKYLVRSVVRSNNVLMTGPTGSGKTMTVRWLAESLGRPLFVFNLGATQDARSSLIGNTHFNKSEGTYFSQSPFIKAIQTPNAVILLDEVSRANPEAFNILMSVLDKNQRYVRIDEDSSTPVIDVHPTVTFIGTANVGVEYSATRVIDRALLDRFVTINMKYLDEEGEVTLLTKLFPSLDTSDIERVAKIVTMIRNDEQSDNSNLTNTLSTRHSIELAALLSDGFSIEEAAELIIYPQFDDDGGLDSERTYVKQLIQSQFGEGLEEASTTDDDERELFNSVNF